MNKHFSIMGKRSAARRYQKKESREELHVDGYTSRCLSAFGKRGAEVRAAKLTPEQRQAIARRAAKARWA